jgi:hypothetical protein
MLPAVAKPAPCQTKKSPRPASKRHKKPCVKDIIAGLPKSSAPIPKFHFSGSAAAVENEILFRLDEGNAVACAST